MNAPNFFSYQSYDDTSDNGPRTAAVLTFSGNTNDSVVKELTQNSLDARINRGGKLKIKVSCKEINKKEIPNFNNLSIVLQQMKNYWNSKSEQYRRFFETADKCIEGGNVKVFIFEDFLTKGLGGDDTVGTFKNCVNDENVSGKEYTDSLGNHGIGKNSVFGYSGIHTVFYSSLNLNGEYKFKGVSKLGTYRDNNKVKRSERIYYGNVTNNESVGLVSDLNSIPNCFRRTESGLSQYVIGAEIKEDWAENVKKAFISNYWFLFETNKLEVEIDGVVLNHDNYFEEALILFDNDQSKENPISFIKSFKTPQITQERKIHKIGIVKLFLSEAKEGDKFPNRIVFLRDGMKIKSDNLGISGLPLNIAGVIYCDDINGNSVLAAMEPHAHNDFLPELVSKKQINNITVNDAKKILYEIKEFKKEVLVEIRNKYSEEAENVDLIDDLFSSILGVGNGSGVGKLLITEDETFNKKYLSQIDYTAKFNSSSKNTLIDNIEDVNHGNDDGEGIGTGSGGKGVTGGENKITNNGGGSSVNSGNIKTRGKNKKNISARFFLTDSNSSFNTYNMILRSDENLDAFNIVLGQHGDSGKSEMTAILKSVKENGVEIEFDDFNNSNDKKIGYRIKNLKISLGNPSVYELQIIEKTESALMINELI